MKKATWVLTSAAAIALAGCASEPDEYEVKGYTSIANRLPSTVRSKAGN